MAGNEAVIRCWEFLRERASDQNSFGVSQLCTATGWSQSSVETYISKQWKAYLCQSGRGDSKVYTVRGEFLRVSVEEFLSIFTQKRLVVPEYQRAKHEVVIQFEFLLPLSKEEQLKQALDQLFYADTLKQRIHEIGLSNLACIIKRDEGLDDRAYIKHVLSILSDYFGGYSISHVQGRFRAAELTDLAGAAKKMKERERYLIDETTAVVRFIAPCYSSKREFGEDINSIIQALKHENVPGHAELEEEILLIRCLFFFFFVETVVWTVRGEDEIWLLETGQARRLYRWTKHGT